MWAFPKCNVFERPLNKSARRYRAAVRSLQSGSGGVSTFAQVTRSDGVEDAMGIETVRCLHE